MEEQKRLNVAIDGPVGAGKSSVADEVARRLGILHLDTGAMYRALGYRALKEKVNVQDEQAVVALCGRMKQMLADRPDQPQMRQAGNLFQRFLFLLEKAPVKHRSVESFAAELCITPKYLSAVCKKQSGKTANEWITQQVLADIRYYLKHTDLSIKQICVRLGFPNPSFFGKYVKEHFGMTPTQLRNS